MEKIELPVMAGKKKGKYIPLTLIIGIAIFITLILLTSLSLTFKKTYKINYSDTSNLDYKVYLKENDYFEEKYLGMQKQYIASLIDYVDANFSYEFKSEEDIDIDYEYYIIANLSVTNEDGKALYEKKEYILNPKKVSIENNTFNINENIIIDYNKYNRLASEFINTYNVTADANINITLSVDIKGTKDDYDKSLSDKGVISLDIPLTTKTLDISMDYDLANNKNAILSYSETVIKNKVLFVGGIISIIFDCLGIITIISCIILSRDELERYKIALNKILKDNERYISETVITERVEDMFNTNSYKVELVKNFNSLMDIRDSINKPILYHEEIKDEEAVFYIISDNIRYVYLMSINDFKR